MTESPALKAFAKRLSSAADNSAFVPPLNQGRYAMLARQMGTSEEAIRKWFGGMAMPRPDKLKALAQQLGVDEIWLAHGRKPDMDRRETAEFAREIEGAVLVVAGMIQLSGGNCAWPDAADPKKGLVDFYTILRGRQFSVRVAYGRPIGDGEYEMTVPSEVEGLTIIGVVPIGRRGRYDFISLPVPAVQATKNRRTGDFVVRIENVEGVYKSGRVEWPLIRNFAEIG